MKKENIVEYISCLSRVSVSPEEKASLGEQLRGILDYVDKLKEADVEGVEPLRNLHTDNAVYRDDMVAAPFCRDRILANAPLRQDRYFKTPKVI